MDVLAVFHRLAIQLRNLSKMQVILILLALTMAGGGGGEATGRMESRIDYELIPTFKNNILAIDAT